MERYKSLTSVAPGKSDCEPRLKKTRSVPLFALLVGINVYGSPAQASRRHLPELKGAVADALSFRDWLQCIGTPSDQIVLLTDKEATYAAIIDALRKLRIDKRISKGDPIFIYYAGHGTELPAPVHWNWSNHDKVIQAIVPYNCDIVDPETKKPVPPISDLFLGTLLGDIALEKGNNIVSRF